jgi:hypothetical protein
MYKWERDQIRIRTEGSYTQRKVGFRAWPLTIGYQFRQIPQCGGGKSSAGRRGTKQTVPDGALHGGPAREHSCGASALRKASGEHGASIGERY